MRCSCEGLCEECKTLHGLLCVFDRCVQRVEWYEKVTYQAPEPVAHSDDSFHQQTQGMHHHGSTPLLDLNINMISAFPIECNEEASLHVVQRSERPEDVSNPNRGGQQQAHQPSSTHPFHGRFMLYTGKIVLKVSLKMNFLATS